MSGGAGTSGVHSVYELEAVAVEQWVHSTILHTVLAIPLPYFAIVQVYALQFEQNNTSASLRKKVMGAESVLKRCYSSGGNDATMDIDAMMAMAKCKQLLGFYPDLLNVLNQVFKEAETNLKKINYLKFLISCDIIAFDYSSRSSRCTQTFILH